MTADQQSHPWPLTGRIDFRFRPGIWAECGPMYNQAGEDWHLTDLIRVILMRGWYPFLTWNLGTLFGREVKGYIGWKPISPANDPAFFWRELTFVQQGIKDDALFLQLSVRGASAAILLASPILALLVWAFI